MARSKGKAREQCTNSLCFYRNYFMEASFFVFDKKTKRLVCTQCNKTMEKGFTPPQEQAFSPVC